MEQYEAEMRQAEEEGDALLVMETALIEIDRLRQQLAAAEARARAAEEESRALWADIRYLRMQVRGSRKRAEAAEAALAPLRKEEEMRIDAYWKRALSCWDRDALDAAKEK